MAKLSDMIIRYELRDCMVDGRLGLFHCWDHYTTGSISLTRAIVEFPEGIEYVGPTAIKFCDETHNMLCEFNKYLKGEDNGTDNSSRL